MLKELSYFLKEDGNLKIVEGLSSVPLELEEYCQLDEAIRYVQHLGCCAMSQHKIRSEYHQLVLEVLRWAVENVGEVFPRVYRGVRSNRPDSEHKILFGTRNLEVAKFYGETVKTYTTIKGIRVKISGAKSVISDSWEEVDDEIIFFP